MIYRKVFVETARGDGYQLPMRVVSSLASKSWFMEPDNVKLEYKRLSKEANEIRNKMLPKSSRKKKKQKWNIVSFSTTTDPVIREGRVDSQIKKKKKLSSKKKRLNTPAKEIEQPLPPPNESEDPMINFNIPCDVSSSPIVDLDSDSAFDNLPHPPFTLFSANTNFDYQQLPPQPQDLQELNFEFYNEEFNIESDTIDFVPGAFDVSINEPGFLTLVDDYCYPPFWWFEY
jgi:hypothetical protein